MRSVLLMATALLVLLSACGDNSDRELQPKKSIPFDKEGTLTFFQDRDSLVTINIEIADSDSARERGLMQRQSLPEKSGMLFIFPEETERSFWMANTPLSLDILFVSADSQIVSIAKYTTPYSSENVRSEGPAQFVIEVPAGFTDSHGIVESDHVRWTRDG